MLGISDRAFVVGFCVGENGLSVARRGPHADGLGEFCVLLQGLCRRQEGAGPDRNESNWPLFLQTPPTGPHIFNLLKQV